MYVFGSCLTFVERALLTVLPWFWNWFGTEPVGSPRNHIVLQYCMKQWSQCTVYPKKYAHGFVVLCFVVVTQSFIMISHEVFIHIHQGCFAGTGAIVRLPQCQRSKPDGYVKISPCITTTKHNKAKTVCIFLGIYCIWLWCIWWRQCVPDNHFNCIPYHCKSYRLINLNIRPISYLAKYSS